MLNQVAHDIDNELLVGKSLFLDSTGQGKWTTGEEEAFMGKEKPRQLPGLYKL
jgi:hypothetical protein